jgi:hypothetical protein
MKTCKEIKASAVNKLRKAPVKHRTKIRNEFANRLWMRGHYWEAIVEAWQEVRLSAGLTVKLR